MILNNNYNNSYFDCIVQGLNGSYLLSVFISHLLQYVSIYSVKGIFKVNESLESFPFLKGNHIFVAELSYLGDNKSISCLRFSLLETDLAFQNKML